MSQDRVNPDLAAVEAAVGSLRPAASGVDRDRLMYLAGRAAGGDGSHHARRRAGWFWPCSTAASLLVAVTFAGMWLSRGEPEVRIVFRDRPVTVPEFYATICAALGIDHKKENISNEGRPIGIVDQKANPVQELIG